MDLYNLACVYVSLMTSVGTGTERATSTARESLAQRGVEALRRSLAAGIPKFEYTARDHDLDPLRGRPDFRAHSCSTASFLATRSPAGDDHVLRDLDRH